MTLSSYSLSITNLLQRYQAGDLTPQSVCDDIRRSIDFYSDYNIWLYVLTDNELQAYLSGLCGKDPNDLPLYGVPFAIKDNIDLAGVPTTAACESYSYIADRSAFLVQCLIDAGAIPIGKTNLDQFATGLVGTRSPYGAVKNAFNPEYISGGSSSGSAVAVALGQVSFSLGTDTAGSGRVPAMLNKLVGLKPSRGLLSMSGVVPACRSLDCPSIFARSAVDALSVFNIVNVYDRDDVYARKSPFSNSVRYSGVPSDLPKIAIPIQSNLNFFGEASSEKLFFQAVEHWQSLGAEIIEINIQPLLDAAKLLYEGPWVAERYAAIESMMQNRPEEVHPVVREIISSAENKTAVEVFQYEYMMQGFRGLAKDMFNDIDFLLTPTAATTYTIKDMLNDPIVLNSNMGYYTNYMNLLDLCGIAVPVGQMENQQHFGVTLVASAMSDQKLLGYAHKWQKTFNTDKLLGDDMGDALKLPDLAEVNTSKCIDVAVCGAHLSGMPLNWQLTERGAILKQQTYSHSIYRLFALAGGPPFRPGMIRDEEKGAAIEVEVWSIPAEEFGGFVAGIPAPLGIGKIELADRSIVSGFICESIGIEGAKEITALGSWRQYIGNIEIEN